MALYSGSDMWTVTPEDKVKHEQVFQSLNPIAGKLSGEQAKKCFMKSNLPSPVLGQIWTLADLDKDGRMTLQEFTIAMHLIQSKLKGVEIPKTLPNNLRISTDPSYQGFPSSGLNQPNSSTMPGMGGSPLMMNGSVGMTPMMGQVQVPNMMGPPMMTSAPNMGFQGGSGGFGGGIPPMNQGNFTTNPGFMQQPLMPTSNYMNQRAAPAQATSMSVFSANVPGGINVKPAPKNSAFDSLSMDSLQGFANIPSNNLVNKTGSVKSNYNIGNISAPNRLKYTQMFKAADNTQSGYLQGEQARQLLIQSNINPQLLAQIWDLSDINKDGRLEMDEFIIAMHLIDSSKAGMTLPPTLPLELIPPHLKGMAAGSGGLTRSDSVNSRSSSTSEPVPAATFEDKRRMNWDKGQQELERRRRELQEKEQKEKEERERKEREEEERKRRAREEAEQKRLQELENQRRQKEEMEREQEMLRKKMIEERLAAQLEAERKRQKEWEDRRREELLNQKGLEENIVKELKSRLAKLKEELAVETSSRDRLQGNYELKKAEGRELHAAIESLKTTSNNQRKDIARLQRELQNSKSQLSSLIEERERYLLEINKKDSTTTSEAIGAIRTSIQQMSIGIERLRKTLSNIEIETANVLKEATSTNEQHRELKTILEDCLRRNNELNQQCLNKRREIDERRHQAELQRKRQEAQRLKQEEMKRKLEADLKRQKEREAEAMRKEQELQKKSQKQRMNAQVEEVLKQQQNLLKTQDANVQKQQDAIGSSKVPPPRPRVRAQGSPAKPALRQISAESFQETASSNDNSFVADFSNFDSKFEADFTAFGNQAQNDNRYENVFDVTFSPTKGKKAPPPRPTPPGLDKPASQDTEIKKTLVTDLMGKIEKKKAEEEEKKKADLKRLEKEKEEIARLKREQEEQDKKLAEKLQQEEERGRREQLRVKKEAEERAKEEAKLKKEAEKRAKQAEKERIERERQAEKDRIEKEKQAEKERIEREKEEEKQRKDAEVKRKVEELQRKKMEKKNATLGRPTPEKRTAVQEFQQFTKTTPYKMMFRFEARNNDEITLDEGSVVMVDENYTGKVPPGWLRGTCNGKSGFFPANYASKVQQENFSDYVDLDPRANVTVEPASAPEAKPKPRSLPLETKAEPFPQLKKVPTPKIDSNAGGSRPKSALLPSGPLKPAQSVKQSKTTEVIQVDLFPRYDYVVSPTALTEFSLSVTQQQPEDIYSVPAKPLSQIAEKMEKPADISEAIREDLYQVPGEAMAAGSAESESLQAVALYPYQAKKDDHLSFDKNDIIIVEQQQDQWWFGRCGNSTGWFPKSYVKLSDDSPPAAVSEVQVEESKEAVAESEPVVKEECVAMFEYVQGQEGDLIFYEGDRIVITKKEGEWWEGECKGKKGLFPANYVKIVESTPQPKTEKLSKPELATVVTAYKAGGLEEISLNVGQLVHITEKDSNGWWRGELQVRGKKRPNGWFPSANVKLKAKAKPEATQQQPAAVVEQSTKEDIYSVPVTRKEMCDQVLALFPYTAQNEDELTFYKGSVIKVISKDGEWWKGELNGHVGVFPYNYVQELGSDCNETTSHWSGSFDITLLKSMTRTEQQRQNHIYELINTEQDYMDDLSLTLEVFYNPMAEESKLTEQELHTVFVNWKELIMCNMKFVKALLVRKKMSETDKIEGIGDILIEQLPRFSPYTRFCSCLVNACRLLQDKVEKDADFKAFEKQCAGDQRLKQNLPLSSYLLKPLQRITKYPLIISGILKYTPEDHYDRENLESALEKAEDMCSQVNEGVRLQENANQLEWLQERVNLEGIEERLTFNSQTNCVGNRKFLRHGVLHKHKSNKELQAFLFNDFLMLCRAQTGHFKSVSNLPMFHQDNDIRYTVYKKPIFLNEIAVKNPTDPDANDQLFHLSHIDRVYSFRAESKNERNNWVAAIQEASQTFMETERARQTRISRARSLGDADVARLVVTIIEGADLQASDPTGTSDPYCQVSMGSQEHKTKVIPRDLNPKWNSTMIFNVKDLDKDVLCVSVFDRDFFSPNDFLGRTEISVATIAKQGFKLITKRLLLHEVERGEIVVTLELQNYKT